MVTYYYFVQGQETFFLTLGLDVNNILLFIYKSCIAHRSLPDAVTYINFPLSRI